MKTWARLGKASGAAALGLLWALGAGAQDVAGDAAAGAKKNALCVGCHGISGYHTAFPQEYRVPKLSGQSAGYLAAALQAYKSGERKHPSMRTLAASLSDQDVADLAAYYASTGPAAPTPAGSVSHGNAQELITKGGCTGCHGDNFSKPVSPTYPKIAGQHADYLFGALTAYKTNDKPLIGRGNPIMGGIARQFSNAELKTIADYVGSLPSDLVTVQPSRFK
jgi:cytochrome c553